MAKKKKKVKQRSPSERISGVVQRIGGVARGDRPLSKAPRTGVSTPRIKPRGNTSQPNGRQQLNPNFGSDEPRKRNKKKKKKR